MVNRYQLRNALKTMGIYSLTKWREQGVWYPLNKYNKPNEDIWVFIEYNEEESSYALTLQSDYQGKDLAKWKDLLEQDQWNIYPLLRDLFEFALQREIIKLESPVEFDYFYTCSEETISIIAKPR